MQLVRFRDKGLRQLYEHGNARAVPSAMADKLRKLLLALETAETSNSSAGFPDGSFTFRTHSSVSHSPLVPHIFDPIPHTPPQTSPELFIRLLRLPRIRRHINPRRTHIPQQPRPAIPGIPPKTGPTPGPARMYAQTILRFHS
jgi:hypothetical protein